ncbi:hypothetical protein Y5S_00982 [Alcanivorax nanhaiticus]|uniref:DUF86 domain-containing protein n=1 Tax=Alcanivorax nanhaiticus TaxID=1177154 RepID=A0A095TTN8_9GAMM|nr:DUF86 domain-containing protein [Alcanivorax nanhaiticus]KGD65758.1 hypothetical protein Y5S_00982 [Alcanivorax nanhaiticus]
MDSLIVERKLESLRRCINRVEQKRPDSIATLETDPDIQDILVLNLSRAVQLCVDIAAHVLLDYETLPPNTMGETFDRLADLKLIEPELRDNLKRSVGFRNMAVHNYDVLDWRIVYAIATRQLEDFTRFAAAVTPLLNH